MKKNLFLAITILASTTSIFSSQRYQMTREEIEEAKQDELEKRCEAATDADLAKEENSPTVRAHRAKVTKKIRDLAWIEKQQSEPKNKSF